MNILNNSPSTSMSATTRIVLAHEQAPVRDGLKTLLSTQAGCEVVAQTGDSLAVEALVRRFSPHLLLLDLGLPGPHGVGIAAALKAEFGASIRVVLLTGDQQPHFVRQALASGADGCVHRSDEGAELLKAVHAVLGGRQYVSRKVAAVFVPSSLRLDAQDGAPLPSSPCAPTGKT